MARVKRASSDGHGETPMAARAAARGGVRDEAADTDARTRHNAASMATDRGIATRRAPTPTLPVDVVARVCDELAAEIHAGACAEVCENGVPDAEAALIAATEARTCLARLMRVNADTYALAGRALYTHVVLDEDNFAPFAYGLDPNLADRAAAAGGPVQRKSKTALLGYTHHATILEVPSVADVAPLPSPLWPNVRTLAFGRMWYLDLADWYDDPREEWYGDDGARNAAVAAGEGGHALEGVLAALAPRDVCVAFPLDSDRGAYFVRRERSGHSPNKLFARFGDLRIGRATRWLQKLCDAPTWRDAGVCVTLHDYPAAMAHPAFNSPTLRLGMHTLASSRNLAEGKSWTEQYLLLVRHSLWELARSASAPHTLEIVGLGAGIEAGPHGPEAHAAAFARDFSEFADNTRSFVLNAAEGRPRRIREVLIPWWTDAPPCAVCGGYLAPQVHVPNVADTVGLSGNQDNWPGVAKAAPLEFYPHETSGQPNRGRNADQLDDGSSISAIYDDDDDDWSDW